MNNNPLVSVIMPAYNAEKTIEESILSVLKQSYYDWELVVVVDNSTDSTLDIMDTFTHRDGRIGCYLNENRLGIAASRNKGIDLAKGSWLAFLDTDDLWSANKLENQLTFMDMRNAKISYTASAFMDCNGAHYNYIMPAVEELTFNELLKRNIMSCSSVMVKRELAGLYGFSSDNVREDYLLWLQIVRETGYAFGLNEPLLTYRMSADSKSSKRISAAIGTYNTYRKIGCSIYESVFRMCGYLLYSIEKRGRIYGK